MASAPSSSTRRISVEVFEENEGALRLYLRHGFRPVDRRPVVPHSCYPHRGDILLLVQNLN